MLRAMHVDVRKAGDVVIVDLQGRLVAGVGDELLREVLDELYREGWKKILLNLSEVSFIDSSGVGELVAGFRAAQQMEVSLKATSLGGRVERVLRLSQILPLLEVYSCEVEALRHFEETPQAPRKDREPSRTASA